MLAAIPSIHRDIDKSDSVLGRILVLNSMPKRLESGPRPDLLQQYDFRRHELVIQDEVGLAGGTTLAGLQQLQLSVAEPDGGVAAAAAVVGWVEYPRCA